VVGATGELLEDVLFRGLDPQRPGLEHPPPADKEQELRIVLETTGRTRAAARGLRRMGVRPALAEDPGRSSLARSGETGAALALPARRVVEDVEKCHLV